LLESTPPDQYPALAQTCQAVPWRSATGALPLASPGCPGGLLGAYPGAPPRSYPGLYQTG